MRGREGARAPRQPPRQAVPSSSTSWLFPQLQGKDPAGLAEEEAISAEEEETFVFAVVITTIEMD